ncbi:MAG: dihydrodipicolinate synthase family protein [Cyclobacteriaceae bacterium]|nr:dihydrodipicolinate synthase family protein [Cyclobacteriaceae bacterium SS2]
MKELYPLHGIVTVLNTPFSHHDQVDLAALSKHVNNALEAGVSGFLIPAMASEVKKLSHAEKLSMVEKVLEVVNGDVPVFAGTAAIDVESSGQLIRTYQSLGCSHFLIQLPFQNEDQFKTDFLTLMDHDPGVVMLQDWDPNGYGLPDELILELFDSVPAFRCLKVETVPAGVKYSNILNLTGGRMNVSGGWAVSQMPEALERGVHAFMPTGMHHIYTKIFSDYEAGNIDQARALFNDLLPVLAFSNQHLDISIHFFKRLLWKQGIYLTPNVRNPILTFDKIHQKIADELIEWVIREENLIKGLG